jgi:hypothetical protein
VNKPNTELEEEKDEVAILGSLKQSDEDSYYAWGIPSFYGDEYDDSDDEPKPKKEYPWDKVKREDGEDSEDYDDRVQEVRVKHLRDPNLDWSWCNSNEEEDDD